MTHWQSPRFFGHFAITASEPAILAEPAAATNQIAFLWRTSPASTEPLRPLRRRRRHAITPTPDGVERRALVGQ
jgi:hypothetical protein